MNVATEGWLNGPLSIATSGYLLVEIPESVDAKSIVHLCFCSKTTNLIIEEANNKIKVSVNGVYDNSIDMQADLIHKTIKFFCEDVGLQVDSYSNTTIKFVDGEKGLDMDNNNSNITLETVNKVTALLLKDDINTNTVDTKVGLVNPIESTELNITGEDCGVGI